jgi:hypothetical protein
VTARPNKRQPRTTLSRARLAHAPIGAKQFSCVQARSDERTFSRDPDIVPVTDVTTPADTGVNAHVGAVVLHRRPKYARILWQACLGKGRHDAPAAGTGYSKLHILTDAHGPSDPIIFDEPRSIVCGLDQEVRSKAVQIESPCGIEIL